MMVFTTTADKLTQKIAQSRIGQLILLILWVSLTNISSVSAQKVRVTNDVKLESGVYLTFESFKKNQPDITWDKVKISAYVNEEKYLAQVDYILLLDEELGMDRMLDLNKIWGFCVNGLPYIRIKNPSLNINQYIGLRTRGKLGYLEIETTVERQVKMNVYNPRTGEPIYSNPVVNKERMAVPLLFDFTSGKIMEFSPQNFEDLVKNDQKVVNTLRELEVQNNIEKLYKLMLIYNDRNPVYFNQ